MIIRIIHMYDLIYKGIKIVALGRLYLRKGYEGSHIKY